IHDAFPLRYAQGDTDLPYELSTPKLAAFRLVAGDGDVTGAASAGGSPGTPDNLMDWAVGGLTGTDSPGQAVAYTTTTETLTPPPPLDCGSAGVGASCKPSTDPYRSQTLYRLPSYALNALTMV